MSVKAGFIAEALGMETLLGLIVLGLIGVWLQSKGR